MQRLHLTKDELHDLISANKYPVAEKHKFLSRCIDGRYKGPETAALAICGGDAGELALLIAAGNAYGFKVDPDKAYKVLVGLLGGEKYFAYHTDHHGDGKLPASGCGHMKQIRLDPKAYYLEEKNVGNLNTLLTKAKKNKATEIVLDGDHLESAVLQIRGNYGVSPSFQINLSEHISETQIFIHHQTLVDQRHRELAKRWIKEGAVKLFNGCDKEYLYEVLCDVTEEHLLETAKRLGSGLPIYQVVFDAQGDFDISELGHVPQA